ncbi:MAG: hypothetical protein MI725_13775 [Pirellulales bacterium]|nr:hypothetical protein [Pirellulales bacterium]
MTSPLRKKHRTTRPNIRRQTCTRQNPSPFLGGASGGWRLALFYCFSCWASAFAQAQSAPLHWGQPVVTSRQTAGALADTGAGRDPQVVAATWEEEDARDAMTIPPSDKSIVIERSETTYDPFEQDDRLARLLEEDPFDEPVEETDQDGREPEIEETEQAIEEELERRQPPRDLDEDAIEKELFGEDPLQDLEKSDPFPEDDWLDDAIESTDDQLQINRRDGEGSDFGSRRTDPLFGPSAEDSEQLRKQLERERMENDKNCAEEFAKIREDTIQNIDLNIRLQGNPGEDFPFECAVGDQQLEPRRWPLLTYNWKASALCHKPLYFEQVRLERYGHSWGRYAQPILSGVHFFGTLPVLPYKMGVRTPCECVYTLGYYRPGNCAPYMIDPVPLSLRGALFQAGAVTGISVTIP